jgi:serine/threonine protein kinase
VDSSDSMFQWLAQRSGENVLTVDEQVIFWTKFSGYAVPIREKLLTIMEARKFVKNLRNTLRSQTTTVMMAKGYVFDCLLGQAGGGKALLYNVIQISTSEVKCGKVYRIESETEDTLRAEIQGSKEVHRDGHLPFIVHYEDFLEFKHESSHYKSVVLIMPLYQLSLAAVLDAFFDTPLPLDMVRKLALCILSAGARFHELGKGHCDLKPENIMVSGGEFTVIDLGAVTTYDAVATEYTRGYYLDADVHSVNSIFDLNCAAVTLARCCIPGFKVVLGMTRAQLLVVTKELGAQNQYAPVLMNCLTASDCGAALKEFQRA